jgi:PAS domain S-box-containing protein
MRNRLAGREELFRLVSENAADMIAVVDIDGRRIFHSDAYQKILGYSAEELKNSSSMDQTHPDDRERVKAAAAEARRSGVGKNLEYRIRCKNGTWLVREPTSSVIGDASGVPEKLVIVNRDLTARKQASRDVIERGSGTLFGPLVAAAFLRVPWRLGKPSPNNR